MQMKRSGEGSLLTLMLGVFEVRMMTKSSSSLLSWTGGAYGGSFGRAMIWWRRCWMMDSSPKLEVRVAGGFCDADMVPETELTLGYRSIV
jgi:hypothetical protein